MKIYYDENQNKEVVDVSDSKTIDEINKEFSGDYTDITAQRETEIITQEAEAEIKNEYERKIQEEIRRIAIDSLTARGEL